jgi:hypothetical protein
MSKARPLRQRDTEPSQVWKQLDADSQHRALQLLARIALNFLTAPAITPPTEASRCLHNEVPQSYDPITSRARR